MTLCSEDEGRLTVDIQDYRKTIDEIDEKLVDLIADRMDVVSKIALFKKENHLPVADGVREKEKLLSILEQTPEGLKEYTPLLFTLLFELSRSYQNRKIGFSSDLMDEIERAVNDTPKLFPENVSVACQGLPGANSQLACDKLFRYPKTFYFSSFEAVFSAVDKGLCDYGVIPVENSIAGSVNSVYDLMMKHNFYIVRSIRLKVNHNLLAKPGAKLEDIREIYSHEQALNQCSEFLNSLKGVRVIPCENTAIAAKKVAESGRNDIAALASDACTEYYGLDCLMGSVQNMNNNYTRFICISRKLEIYPGADQTSLMMVLPHVQGSLYKALSRFHALGINLNKLESRPIPDKEFEVMFYFDLDTPIYSPRLIQLIGELPTICDRFQYLGSYSEVF